MGGGGEHCEMGEAFIGPPWIAKEPESVRNY